MCYTPKYVNIYFISKGSNMNNVCKLVSSLVVCTSKAFYDPQLEYATYNFIDTLYVIISSKYDYLIKLDMKIELLKERAIAYI